MKAVFLLVALTGVAAIWMLDRMTAADLRTQITAAREENASVETLRRERDRLRRRERELEDLHRLQRDAAERARVQRESAAREETVRRASLSNLQLGEWLSPDAWKNRGQATPIATVETALWAAAGGDVVALEDLLLLEDAVRAKANAVLSRLPEISRPAYANAERLIATFTAKSIPLSDAQLVWQQQLGPDDAVACVFLKNPVGVAPPIAADSPPLGEKVPPTAPPNTKTSATYLSLRRSETGWRLVVPQSAVEKIAKDLAGAMP